MNRLDAVDAVAVGRPLGDKSEPHYLAEVGGGKSHRSNRDKGDHHDKQQVYDGVHVAVESLIEVRETEEKECTYQRKDLGVGAFIGVYLVRDPPVYVSRPSVGSSRNTMGVLFARAQATAVFCL